MRADYFTHVEREISEYIGKEYTNGGDVQWLIEKGKQKTTEPPSSLATNATDVDKDFFKVDVSKYIKRRNRPRENLESSFTLILGKCNKLTQIKLEVLTTWEAVDDRSDVIKLINMVKSLSHQTTDQNYHPLSLYMAKQIMYRLHQGPDTTNTQLAKKIKEIVEVIEEIGGTINVDTKRVEDKLTVYIK